MKRISLGLILWSLFGIAHAADLPLKAATALPPVLDMYTGFYIGGEIGYGWNLGNTGCAMSSGLCDLGTLSAAPQGFVGGGFLGWGTRIPGLLGPFGLDGYFGIEGNGDVANLTGSAAMPALLTVVNANTDWLASARGRFGLIYQNVMFYGTAGWGWGSSSLNVMQPVTGVTGPTLANTSTTQSGLAWGGGVEFPWFFGPGWKARMQYLQYDFGTFGAPCTNTAICPTIPDTTIPALNFTQKDRIDTITAGLSYKF
jgi:outer membrane immunogenic protein